MAKLKKKHKRLKQRVRELETFAASHVINEHGFVEGPDGNLSNPSAVPVEHEEGARLSSVVD